MNATTNQFLTGFTPKLEQLFHDDLSSEYLERMNEHLQTFYNDVLTELEIKQNAMSKRIDGNNCMNKYNVCDEVNNNDDEDTTISEEPHKFCFLYKKKHQQNIASLVSVGYCKFFRACLLFSSTNQSLLFSSSNDISLYIRSINFFFESIK